MAAAAFDLLAGDPISDYEPQPAGEVRRLRPGARVRLRRRTRRPGLPQDGRGDVPAAAQARRRQGQRRAAPDHLRPPGEVVRGDRAALRQGCRVGLARARAAAPIRGATTARSSSLFAPEVLSTLDLSGEYGRSIKTYLTGGENVIAAGPKATVQQLAQQAARGDLTMARAERLAGSAEFLREYGRARSTPISSSSSAASGRSGKLASRSKTSSRQDRIVPVGQLLRESMESFACVSSSTACCADSRSGRGSAAARASGSNAGRH